MTRAARLIDSAGRACNIIASAAIIIMMLLTCADVLLRLFHRPIPGTYELVGFLGTAIISFSLAYTSIEKGHIAVDILFDRLPFKVRVLLSVFNDLVGAVFFGIVAWQSALYAVDIRQSREVSLTLGIPVYPFVYGIAFGCAMLSLVLLVELGRDLKRAIR